MKRRDFLKSTGLFAAQVLGSSAVMTPALIRQAKAATGLPIDRLRSGLRTDDALLVTPNDRAFGTYENSFNLRVRQTPQVRVLVKTPEAVATAIDWAATNNVPFSIRGGGHSYEGLSQSLSLVIDTRLMSDVVVSPDRRTVSVGGGALLGNIYQTISQYGLAIPAGSCPPVGVAGHSLGGGFGLLARPYGLACDNLVSIELVDAQGRVLNVSVSENPDLFWALRGGGSGSFGVATRFEFRTHQLQKVAVFGMGWVLPLAKAREVMKAWQAWAPSAPDSITSIFRVGRDPSGNISLHCAGQSIDSEVKLRAELANLTKVAPTGVRTETMSFIQAVKHFAGGGGDPAIYMKGRSDYLFQPMSDEGITALMTGLQRLPTGAVVAICDSYGGAVNRLANDATAFAHRTGTQYSIQYYSSWSSAALSAQRVAQSKSLWDSMRPYVSGAAYLNYCDLDLKNYAQAYWGSNLPRLQQIKRAVDPNNLFRHVQSIPLT